MNADIQSVRELVERRAQEDALIRQLPQLEQQARREHEQERAVINVQRLEPELDTALTKFQTQKAESDSEFLNWLAQGKKILTIRQHLAQQADMITRQSEMLAEVKLLAGIVKSPFDRVTANRAQGQEEIKNRTGQYRLVVFDNLDSQLFEILENYNR